MRAGGLSAAQRSFACGAINSLSRKDSLAWLGVQAQVQQGLQWMSSAVF
jgi:hypothetical protein